MNHLKDRHINLTRSRPKIKSKPFFLYGFDQSNPSNLNLNQHL